MSRKRSVKVTRKAKDIQSETPIESPQSRPLSILRKTGHTEMH